MANNSNQYRAYGTDVSGWQNPNNPGGKKEKKSFERIFWAIFGVGLFLMVCFVVFNKPYIVPVSKLVGQSSPANAGSTAASLPPKAPDRKPVQNTAQRKLTAADLSKIFSGESYWEMTYRSHAEGSPVIGKFYVKLWDIQDNRHTEIINQAGDDLQYGKYGWSYDDENEILVIRLLEDPWNSGIFSLQDGVLTSGGQYYIATLEQTAGAERSFENTYSRFRKNYGSYNPVKRLVNSNNSFRFRENTEINSMPYEDFRYVAMNHSMGIVKAEPDAADVKRIRQEVTSLLGSYKADPIHVHQVFFDVNYPETDDGFFYYGNVVDVVNLVVPDGMTEDMFMQLSQNIDCLLTGGAATGGNGTANDLLQASMRWNDEQAAVVIQYGYSLLVFRGPKAQVQQVATGLLDSALWY